MTNDEAVRAVERWRLYLGERNRMERDEFGPWVRYDDFVAALTPPVAAEGGERLPTEMLSEPGIWKGWQSQIENRTLWVGTSDRGEVLIKATNPNNAQPEQKIAFTKEGGEHLLMLLHCAMEWPDPAAPPASQGRDGELPEELIFALDALIACSGVDGAVSRRSDASPYTIRARDKVLNQMRALASRVEPGVAAPTLRDGVFDSEQDRQECADLDREAEAVRSAAPVDEGLCAFCGEPVNNLAGNPSLWSLTFSHPDGTGKAKLHHVGCVTSRLFAAPAGLLDHCQMSWEPRGTGKVFTCRQCGESVEADHHPHRKCKAYALAARPGAGEVEGWALVPTEATASMVMRGSHWFERGFCELNSVEDAVERAWSDMVTEATTNYMEPSP